MPPDFAEASRWLAYAMEDLEHGKLAQPHFRVRPRGVFSKRQKKP